MQGNNVCDRNLNASLANAGEQIILGSKKNVILQKSEIGEAKSSTRKLPDSNFRFGKVDMLYDRATVDQGK